MPRLCLHPAVGLLEKLLSHLLLQVTFQQCSMKKQKFGGVVGMLGWEIVSRYKRCFGGGGFMLFREEFVSLM